MANVVVRSGEYKGIKVVPGAAKASGLYEVFGELAGFYLTAFTAAQFTAGESAALIIEAEQVDVTKNAGETWVAGEAIFWDVGNTEATNVKAVNHRCIGFAREAAASADIIASIYFNGALSNGKQIRSGSIAVTVSELSVDTGLALIEDAYVTVKGTTQGAGVIAYATVDFGADGLLDIYGWDDAGAAASVATTVSWIAIGA